MKHWTVCMVSPYPTCPLVLGLLGSRSCGSAAQMFSGGGGVLSCQLSSLSSDKGLYVANLVSCSLVGELADCFTPGTVEQPDLGRFNIGLVTLKVSFEPLSNFSWDQFEGGRRKATQQRRLGVQMLKDGRSTFVPSRGTLRSAVRYYGLEFMPKSIYKIVLSLSLHFVLQFTS